MTLRLRCLFVLSLISNYIYAHDSSGASVCQLGYEYICDDLNVCECKSKPKTANTQRVLQFKGDGDSLSFSSIPGLPKALYNTRLSEFKILEIENLLKFDQSLIYINITDIENLESLSDQEKKIMIEILEKFSI